MPAVTANRTSSRRCGTSPTQGRRNDLHRDYETLTPDVEGDGAVPGTTLQFGPTPNEQGTVWKDGTWVRILDDKDFDPMYGDLRQG